MINVYFTVHYLYHPGLCLSEKTHNSNPATVTIRVYYEKPKSLSDKSTIVLKGISEGEYVEAVVVGTIRDFQLVRLEWDQKENDVVEKETIHKISEIKDKTIVIKTYIPEGIPCERIKWKSITDKRYEFTVQEDLSDDSQGYWKFVCN